MRYYKIEVSDEKTGRVLREFSSHVNGVRNPAAQNVELDLPVASYATPYGGAGAFVRLWGVDIRDVSQAQDFGKKKIKVYGGMGRGLPLAKPGQAGLLAFGLIQQAFGNWQSTNMTLDFIVQADAGSVEDPKNITFQWTKGSKMGPAITETLKRAFPTLTINVKVSDKLVASETQSGFFQNLGQFASEIKSLSMLTLKQIDYTGVEMVIKEKSIDVYDGSSRANPRQINFEDMIGQPTWIGLKQTAFKCVMRADLQVGDYVKMPITQAANTAQSYSQYRDRALFQGLFQLYRVQHFGNFRQPDGDSWNTSFEAFQVPNP